MPAKKKKNILNQMYYDPQLSTVCLQRLELTVGTVAMEQRDHYQLYFTLPYWFTEDNFFFQ